MTASQILVSPAASSGSPAASSARTSSGIPPLLSGAISKTGPQNLSEAPGSYVWPSLATSTGPTEATCFQTAVWISSYWTGQAKPPHPYELDSELSQNPAHFLVVPTAALGSEPHKLLLPLVPVLCFLQHLLGLLELGIYQLLLQVLMFEDFVDVL